MEVLIIIIIEHSGLITVFWDSTIRSTISVFCFCFCFNNVSMYFYSIEFVKKSTPLRSLLFSLKNCCRNWNGYDIFSFIANLELRNGLPEKRIKATDVRRYRNIYSQYHNIILYEKKEPPRPVHCVFRIT